MYIKSFGVCGLFGALLLGSCSSSVKESQTVKTAYIHRYGVKVVNEKDFLERGGSGEIVQTLRDGSSLRKTYVNGAVEGRVLQSFPHSEVIHRIQVYEHGALKEEVENYPSGVPMVKTEFTKDGAKQSLQKTYWFEDGSPKATEKVLGDKILKAEYFTPFFELEASIENGTGTKITRDAAGILVKKEILNQGIKTLEVRFHPNGVIAEEFAYVNGAIDGVKKTFTDAGAPRSVEEWKCGELHGTVILFEKGVKVACIPYIHGKKHGTEKQFKPGSEKVVAEVSWDHDQKHGPQVSIVDDVRITDWFFYNEKTSKSDFITRSRSTPAA